MPHLYRSLEVLWRGPVSILIEGCLCRPRRAKAPLHDIAGRRVVECPDVVNARHHTILSTFYDRGFFPRSRSHLQQLGAAGAIRRITRRRPSATAVDSDL